MRFAGEEAEFDAEGTDPPPPISSEDVDAALVLDPKTVCDAVCVGTGLALRAAPTKEPEAVDALDECGGMTTEDPPWKLLDAVTWLALSGLIA